MVTMRTREVGIRMALGAQRHQVLALVLAQGLRLAGAGLALGLAAAIALTRFLTTLLYEVRPLDVATLAGVALMLGAVAAAACIAPARCAACVDPMLALRCE